MKRIRKAVIPAAGYGTRMLPITKSISKEMLPLVDKPVIQVVVEELVEAGIEDIIIVTAAHKADLVAYFGDTEPGLLAHLQESGKSQLLQDLQQVAQLANFSFVEQKGVYGTGTPVLGCLRCTRDDDYDRYGYVDGEEVNAGVLDMKRVVEKPGKSAAPSDLASLGFYLATPEVVDYLHRVRSQLTAGKELFFPEAFNLMIADGKHVMAKEIIDAQYFDTGNKLDYMKASVAMAARHPEIGNGFKEYLREFLADESGD
jgi:UTP--glucose-1-phosphate uridylyltransferase